MHRSFLLAGAIFGMLGVALGAFGAHGLQKITDDESIIRSFQTGVQYQIYHALALLAVDFLYDKWPRGVVKGAGICFITGTVLFSGSLYLITYFKIQESAIPKFIGPVTPIGGLFFIVGWLLFALSAINSRSQR
jgi:uncharacterized membrane protein YgdD (TMEM256/DUF423 family)